MLILEFIVAVNVPLFFLRFLAYEINVARTARRWKNSRRLKTDADLFRNN